MKRFMLNTIVFLLLFVIIFPFQAGADSFMPSWQAGDRWLVKAIYPSHAAGDKWSEPVFWDYEVIGLEGYGPEARYILEIRDRDGRVNLKTRLAYSAGDLSLVRAEILSVRRGEESVRVLAYDGGTPVVTEQTLAPFDSPAFPLAWPSSAEFSVIRQIDGLKDVRSVRQEVRWVTESDEVPGHLPGSRLIEVKFTGKDGLIFVQYWDRAYPWPVYGENINMRYWLVKE